MIIIGSGVVEWVAKRTNEFGNFGCAVGIGWRKQGALVAGVAYSDYNGVNMQMHVASDGTRRWLNREYLRVCFDYPFNQAEVQRVTGCVGEGNAKAREFIEHLGFERETRLSGAHPTGDLLIYCMRKPQCRWLQLKKVSHEERMAA